MAKKQSSFDVVSRIDDQEVKNAVNQATHELRTRFDLKGTGCEIQIEPDALVLVAPDEVKLRAVDEILATKLARRKVPLEAMTRGDAERAAGGRVRQRISMQRGIPMEKAKEIVKLIKKLKLKLQAQILEDSVRVSGKKRDDLQDAIRAIKDSDLGIHMQFTNYRN